VTRYAYVWSATALFARYASFLRVALLIGLFFAFTNTTNAADVNPLRPVDTSSPRATMQSFVGTMDQIYRGITDVMQDYAASGRLYLTPDESSGVHARISIISRLQHRGACRAGPPPPDGYRWPHLASSAQRYRPLTKPKQRSSTVGGSEIERHEDAHATVLGRPPTEQP
jgi:hypothetical protein